MARVMKHDTGTHRKSTAIVPARHAPLALFPRWMERFEDLFGEMWQPFWTRFPEDLALKIPPLDVYEEGGDVVVKAELPGMKKEEIDIRLSGNALVISGTREKEEKLERKDYARLERAAGAFRRSVTLPAEVAGEKMTATYKDGVLEIRAPRVEGAEAKGRKIEIA